MAFIKGLTSQEKEYTEFVLGELQSVPWARPLVNEINSRGGIAPENRPMLFEARIAYELYCAGVHPHYEYKTGVGGSSIDFRIEGTYEWLIEVVSIHESKGVKEAVHEWGNGFSSFYLSSSNFQSEDKKRQSEESEFLIAQSKIGEKVYRNEQVTKFPFPKSNSLHIILVDMRGFLGGGQNAIESREDYYELTYGGRALSSKGRSIHGILDQDGEKKPLIGLFEENVSHPLKAAPFLQERIHLIGFVTEDNFCQGEIRSHKAVLYLPNPKLLTDEKAIEVFQKYPLTERTSNET
jgi:hypothetical protein